MLSHGDTFKSVISELNLLGGNMSKARKGNDHGDHPPITPTRSVNSPSQVRLDIRFKLILLTSSTQTIIIQALSFYYDWKRSNGDCFFF